MEVADQWRRQWAGTAEYGKVTEGGVTRRVARAMEVLHASGPGARVRVMRAAYHSTAGPGAPAESFMLHSSRRVISSGFNFLEAPSLNTRPLEISSTPLEPIQDSTQEPENYKVTEPDDVSISEPSKWRSSTTGSSLRMPSEESSSTDNASVIDLDSRNNKNLHRKYSYDSESSDMQFRSRSSSRSSLLLDTPTTLSTLKYKSFLNNSNEWNARRKSYSFEDTSPLNETILHNNETLAMDSSTDSGICKSTEIMNDHIDDNMHQKYFGKSVQKSMNHKEESFSDWLTKNRYGSQFRGTKLKSYRDHDIVIEDPKETKISLQSFGKVSITLPVTVEVDHESDFEKEEFDKRVKKVEFCKTEVHFAAESGKVNIIATDNKPPPTNDFRKRRSAFVPLQDVIDRPITLFGDKIDFPTINGVATTLNHINGDFNDPDENTAATKGILKNKIPKPKPYLLGENMEFGGSVEFSKTTTNKSVLTAVALVNQQIESDNRYKDELKSIFSKAVERNIINDNVIGTTNSGPTKIDSLKSERSRVMNIKIEKANDDASDSFKSKCTSVKSSPTQIKPKTRQLRDSDLTYFGIDNNRKTQEDKTKSIETSIFNDNIFQSVKLIQQVSNSVSNSACNSEPESEDSHEYQNFPLNLNRAPVPTPRSRSKYDYKPNEIAAVRATLKPILETKGEEIRDLEKRSTRRTKVRRQEEVKSNRSLSEPPKRNTLERSRQPNDQSASSSKLKFPIDDKIMEDVPIYANLNKDTEKLDPLIVSYNRKSTSERKKEKQEDNTVRHREKTANDYSVNVSCKRNEQQSDSQTNSFRRKNSSNSDTLSSTLRKETKSDLKRETQASRGERTSKSHNSHDVGKQNTLLSEKKHANSRNNKYKNEHNDNTEQNRQSLRKTVPKDSSNETRHNTQGDSVRHCDTRNDRKRNTSKDKVNGTCDNVKTYPKLNVDSAQKHASRQLKSTERDQEVTPKHHHRSNKHREYVINYNEKNGTVSSICKIKSEGSPSRKKANKEIPKINQKDHKFRSKTVDKIALLQFEDQQKEPNGLIYADRKWKTKVHVKRSCQFL